MNKINQLKNIKNLYAKGGNIIKYLKSIDGTKENSIEDILISYDFQSGSYIKEYSKNSEFKSNYCSSLAKIIDKLGNFDSLMEVGVGEGTTLGPLLRKLDNHPKNVLGFDISWSRLKFAKEILIDFGFKDATLVASNLFEIPLLDNSVDLIYTSHSLEPNGGREKQALAELMRVARKYVILLEPAYELADKKSKERMESHGYVTNLYQTANDLGLEILDYRLFEHSINPLNPTGILILKKESFQGNDCDLRCPVTLSKLDHITESLLFSVESNLSYPVIFNIPCLLKENSILTSHLSTNYEEFKRINSIKF